VLTRRRVLTAAGGGALALAAAPGLAACTNGAPLPAVPRRTDVPHLDPTSWTSVRAQFPLTTDAANFTTFVFASHPASVQAAIEGYRAGLDTDPYGFLNIYEVALDEAVASAAATYLLTRAEQIALTDSTTMGLGLLYSGLHLNAGDEVLTTEHDFYSTHETLRLRSVRDGVVVRRVRLYDDPEHADGSQIVGRLLVPVPGWSR
jgi:selenocysteine lyase/cysteine desulfurase